MLCCIWNYFFHGIFSECSLFLIELLLSYLSLFKKCIFSDPNS